MAYKNQILLGRISKILGYEGIVNVKLEKVFIDNVPEMESVFIETEGRPVPFFISQMQYQGGDLLKLQFEGYESFEKMSEYAGCMVFLTTSPENSDFNSDYENITGFKILLKDNRTVGIITDILLNPGQNLMVVTSPEKKEILIPLHQDFIVSFDEDKKIIVVDIPEGLTEIN